MRDHWLDEHVGNEVTPRPGFEDQLAETLHTAWREPAGLLTTSPPPTRSPRRLLAVVWATAAVAVLAVGAAIVTRDEKPQITGDTTPATVPSTVVPSTSLAPSTTIAPTTTAVPSTSVPPPATASTPEEQTVLDYLSALAEGRYDDAAKVLGEGGLELAGRADLRPLFDDQGAMPDLAAALQAWCELPALCRVPTGLASDGNRIVATFTVDGVQRSSMFVGATFEGQPLAYGLPLRLPPAGQSIADTVACPTTDVDTTLQADLDGDGWAEVVTVQHAPQSADPQLISVCGTTLVVDPLLIVTEDQSHFVYVLDVDGDGTDELLIGVFAPDGLTGDVYEFDGTSIVDSGRGSVTQTNPIDGTPGNSFGCEDLDADGTRDLVGYTYEYEGGSDLSNSTALTYTATLLAPNGAGGTTQDGRFELPAQETEAFHVIGAYCGALQVQTG